MWKIEILGIEPHYYDEAQEGIVALEKFFAMIEIVHSRYQIKWLCKYDLLNLEDNFNVAFKRLENTILKLREIVEFPRYYINLLKSKMIVCMN